MADKYERWNKWAPQFIADLVHDFGLTPEQAAGFVGNFAAESAYFNDIVEDAAIAKGWKGGTGFAQWTAARRLDPTWGFEAWLKKKKWAADSYEGNYSYLYRELKGEVPRSISGLDPKLIDIIKASHSLDGTPEGVAANAAYRVAKYFEKPEVINTGPRAKAAKEALELYRKNPVPPTKWATDVKEEPTMPVVPVPVGPVTPIPGSNEDRAIPWYDSKQLNLALTGIVGAFVAIIMAYDFSLPIQRQNWGVLVPLIVTFLSAVFAFIHRITAEAQPVTGTRKEANKINAERTAEAAVQVAAAASPAFIPVVPEQQPTSMPVPLEAKPLNELVHELPQVISMLGLLIPAFAAIGPVVKGLEGLTNAMDRNPQQPR